MTRLSLAQSIIDQRAADRVAADIDVLTENQNAARASFEPPRMRAEPRPVVLSLVVCTALYAIFAVMGGPVL